MKKITDVGRNLRREGNQLVSHPVALGGRADLYNGFRTMNNPRFAHSGDRVPDLYQVMIDYHLKGFEFGNWVNTEERNDYAAGILTTLKELATILGTKNIGFDSQIGIAFGARGHRGAAAHYEPRLNMINLTKKKGAGSLAHEYGHALDYCFGAFIDQNKDYTALSGGTSVAKTLPDNTGCQFRAWLNQIIDSIVNGKNYQRAWGSNPYWRERCEIWARFFEQYICYLYKQKGQSNSLLHKSWSYYITDKYYVAEDDFLKIKPLADRLIREMGAYMNNGGSARVKKTAVPLRKMAYQKPLIAPPTPKPAPKQAPKAAPKPAPIPQPKPTGKAAAQKAKKPAADTKPAGTRQPIVPLNTPATSRDYPHVQMSPKELAEATGLTQKTILALDGCCLKNDEQTRPGIRFIYIGKNLAIATEAHVLDIVYQKARKEQLVFAGSRKNKLVTNALNEKELRFPSIAPILPNDDQLTLLRKDASVSEYIEKAKSADKLNDYCYIKKDGYSAALTPTILLRGLRVIDALGWKTMDMYCADKKKYPTQPLYLKTPNAFIVVMPMYQAD